MATGHLQLDNGTFRVTKWMIEPADAIAMHSHAHDYVVVPLENGTMHAVTSGGSETTVQLAAGHSYARKAGAEHTIENHSDKTVCFVEIEKL